MNSLTDVPTMSKSAKEPAEPVMNPPKVLLHDHLDGGLRPLTVVQLAAESGYTAMPVGTDEVGRFFEDRAIGSLKEYLAPFEHTVAVMQTPGSLRRVAMESVIDHAAAGVVYAELRMAPSLHMQRGLTRRQAIESTLDGLDLGQRATGMAARLIVCAMRHQEDAIDVVKAATALMGRGVVGIDLAGPEAGFPARRHREALQLARESGLHLTIHAGEGLGAVSIEDALECGAERIGHGVRIVEDMEDDGSQVTLGATADRVRQEGIALEICPKSEVDTGAVRSAAAHPIDVLHREGFVTTINTDNTLMSMTDMSREFDLLSWQKGFTMDDFRSITLNAVEAAFCDVATKDEIRATVRAGYDEVAAQ